jgi:sec-independent protein translocase protein TatB
MGRARRFLSTVKADIDRELRAEELRRILNKQAQVPGVDEIIEEGSMAFRSQELGGKSVPPTPPSGDRAKSVSGTPSAPTGGRAQSASAPPSTPAAPSSSPSADEGK